MACVECNSMPLKVVKLKNSNAPYAQEFTQALQDLNYLEQLALAQSLYNLESVDF